MSKNSFKIHTLGCKVNQYESGQLANALVNNNFLLVKENADLIIINSCAVTETAIKKSKKILKQASLQNPQAKVILTGCWPVGYEIDRKLNIDLIISEHDLGKRVEKIKELFNLKKTINNNEVQTSITDRSRYFIKIQDGCNQFCSYCIIPYTRGSLHSRSEQDILLEIEKAVCLGFEEIILSGIHLGLYGVDSGTNLVNLLKKIIKIEKLKRVRLSSIEITEVNDELISLMASTSKICQHLHVSLQSGSDKILKAMNRPYNTAYFKKRVEKLRTAFPQIAISTDVIVGFPGESKELFLETKRFLQEIQFSRLHVFSFSAHKKTPAFNLPNKVEQGEIKKRSQELRALSKELEKKYAQQFLNKELDVVVITENKGKYLGKTEYYFDFIFTAQDIVSVFEHQGLQGKDLIGKIVRIKFLLNNN